MLFGALHLLRVFNTACLSIRFHIIGMKLIILFLCWAGELVHARCPLELTAQFPFALEYALWRGWQQTVVFNSDVELGKFDLLHLWYTYVFIDI